MTINDESDWCRQLASAVQNPELKRALEALAETYERAAELDASGCDLTEIASFDPVSAAS